MVYRICGQNIMRDWLRDKEVYLRIKLETDISDDIDINKVVKTADINNVFKKINKIIKKTNNMIENQKIELKKEDISSNYQMEYSRSLIFFTVVQIILVILIGLCHFLSFKNYLVHHHVIKN